MKIFFLLPAITALNVTFTHKGETRPFDFAFGVKSSKSRKLVVVGGVDGVFAAKAHKPKTLKTIHILKTTIDETTLINGTSSSPTNEEGRDSMNSEDGGLVLVDETFVNETASASEEVDDLLNETYSNDYVPSSQDQVNADNGTSSTNGASHGILISSTQPTEMTPTVAANATSSSDEHESNDAVVSISNDTFTPDEHSSAIGNVESVSEATTEEGAVNNETIAIAEDGHLSESTEGGDNGTSVEENHLVASTGGDGNENSTGEYPSTASGNTTSPIASISSSENTATALSPDNNTRGEDFTFISRFAGESCDFKARGTSQRSIEMPYFYILETIFLGGVVEEIEESLHLMVCLNGGGRLLAVASDEEDVKIVAVESSPKDIVSDKCEKLLSRHPF